MRFFRFFGIAQFLEDLVAEEIGRPHGDGEHGEGENDEETVGRRPAEHPARVFAPPVGRAHWRQAGCGFKRKRCAEDEGGDACQKAAQRHGQPAFLPVFEQGVEHDGAQYHDEGDVRHAEAACPVEQFFHLPRRADKAQIEQQAAADAVTRQLRHQAAAFGDAEDEAEQGYQDAEGQRVSACGDYDGNQRNQRAVRAGQVGGGQEKARQEQDEQRGDEQLVAHVFQNKAFGQP